MRALTHECAHTIYYIHNTHPQTVCAADVLNTMFMSLLFAVSETDDDRPGSPPSGRLRTSVSDLAKKVAGHQGVQLPKVVGPDEKLWAQNKLITNNIILIA